MNNCQLVSYEILLYDMCMNFIAGRHDWEVMQDYAACKLRRGQTLTLTISQCYPNKYTCNNGDCISLRLYPI